MIILNFTETKISFEAIGNDDIAYTGCICTSKSPMTINLYNEVYCYISFDLIDSDFQYDVYYALFTGSICTKRGNGIHMVNDNNKLYFIYDSYNQKNQFDLYNDLKIVLNKYINYKQG